MRPLLRDAPGVRSPPPHFPPPSVSGAQRPQNCADWARDRLKPSPQVPSNAARRVLLKKCIQAFTARLAARIFHARDGKISARRGRDATRLLSLRAAHVSNTSIIPVVTPCQRARLQKCAAEQLSAADATKNGPRRGRLRRDGWRVHEGCPRVLGKRSHPTRSNSCAGTFQRRDSASRATFSQLFSESDAHPYATVQCQTQVQECK